jgi:hypothetical protein
VGRPSVAQRAVAVWDGSRRNRQAVGGATAWAGIVVAWKGTTPDVCGKFGPLGYLSIDTVEEIW